MKREFIKFITNLIPFRELRRRTREYLLSEDKAYFNGMCFNVNKNSFWYYFNSGRWEPQTKIFYKKYTCPTKEVIDIGGWMGPTALIAYAMNAKKISVVEADPTNFHILKNNCLRNYLEDKMTIHNLCISNKSGEVVSFGCDSENKSSSMKRIGLDGVKVVTTSISEFLSQKDLSNVNIIKIDIEGAEQNIIEGLDYIAQYPNINLLFSLHPPFWKNFSSTMLVLLDVFKKFDIYDETEQAMSLENFETFLYKSKDEFPTIILKTRKVVP